MSDKLSNSNNGRYQHNYSYVVNQAKRVATHMRRHQNKYFFLGWLVGWAFLFVKIIMLFGASFMLYSGANDASFADDIVIVWEQEEEWESMTIEELEDLLELDEEVDLNDDIDLENDMDSDLEEENENILGDNETIDETDDLDETNNHFDWDKNETDPIIIEDGDLDLPEHIEEVCDYKWFSFDLDWNIFSGLMNISREIGESCHGESVDIQLYDHNEERITLETIPGYMNEFIFDTKLLNSGFYVETGLNSSGEIEILREWLYPWEPTDDWDGYYIRRIVQPNNILHQTPEFRIDNRPPNISDFKISVDNRDSWIVIEWEKLEISFEASEELTGTKLYINSKLIDEFESDWLIYNTEYTIEENIQKWKIAYEIYYQDLAWNTWYVQWESDLFIDTDVFELGWFSISGYDFSFSSTKESRANAFVIIKDTTNWWAFEMTWLSMKHQFSLPSLSLNTEYDMWIFATDSFGNEAKAAFTLNRGDDWDINYNLLATLYWWKLLTYGSGQNFLTETGALNETWDQSIIAEFKEELDKFTQCKNDIEYSKVRIQIKWVELELNVPMFQKSEIKNLVNSFVIYVLKELEKTPLSQIELKNIADNFDGFLVIMKLLKDDNNVCKQSLSTHAVSQFMVSMDRYWIDF